MVFWQKFDPEQFDFEFDEIELARHSVTIDEVVEVIWNGFDVRRNKRYHGGYQITGYTDGGPQVETDRLRETKGHVTSNYWLGYMTARKKISEREIRLRLIEDAKNPDAWEAPTIVPPSHVPRPEWYGRTKHLELAAKFYVLSVLHRLGAEANLTFAQPDNVDIAAVRESGEAFTIDVKTLMGTSQWPVEQFSARKHHFVVFVRYGGEWRNPQVVPDIYIWSSESLKAVIAKATSVSLEDVASKLDPMSAWQQFTTVAR